jgi:chromosome partitioning protein
MTAKVYAVANRKGGVGKTTTVGALASGLSRRGQKVLVVDCDPQGDSTDWAGIEVTPEMYTLGDVLKNDIMYNDNIIRESIVKAKYFDIIPSGPNMFSIEKEIDHEEDRTIRLKERLYDVLEDYDVVVMDTPPALSIMTLNAFIAADSGIILVTDAGSFATKGMSELADEIHRLHRRYDNVKVIGILVTQFMKRSNFMKRMHDVTAEFAGYFEEATLYSQSIRQSVHVMQCQGESVDLFDAALEFGAKADYDMWVDEFFALEKLGEE